MLFTRPPNRYIHYQTNTSYLLILFIAIFSTPSIAIFATRQQSGKKPPFTLQPWDVPGETPPARAFHLHAHGRIDPGAEASGQDVQEVVTWYHGGLGPDGPLNDLWAFSGKHSSNSPEPSPVPSPTESNNIVADVRGTWEQLLPVQGSRLPPPRYGHTGAMRRYLNTTDANFQIRHFLYIFGGKGAGKDEFLNDMWAVDLQEDRLTWKKVRQSGSIPSPRYMAAGGGFVTSVTTNNNKDESLRDETAFTFMSLSHGIGPNGPLTDAFLCSFDFKDPYSVHWRHVNGPWNQHNPWRPHGHYLAAHYTSRGGKHFIYGGCYGTEWTGGNCPAQNTWALKYNYRERAANTNVDPTATPQPGREISAKEKADGLPIDVWRQSPRGPSPRFLPALNRGLYSFGGQALEEETLVLYCGSQQYEDLVTDQIVKIDPVDCLELDVLSFKENEKWRTRKLEYVGDEDRKKRAIKRRVGLSISPFVPFKKTGDGGVRVGRERYLVFGGRTEDGEFYSDTFVIDYDSSTNPEISEVIESVWWSFPQIHGIFMFMAFGLLFPFGAIVSRYCKKRSLWFKIHLVSQSVGLLFTIIGFVLILHSRKGSVVNIPHAIIGLLLIALLFFQVLMTAITKVVKKIMIPIDYSSRLANSAEHGAYDPARDGATAKWVRVWRPLHRGLGWILVALGATNVTLGQFLLVLPFIVWMHWLVSLAIVVLVLIIFEIAGVGKRSRHPERNMPDDTEGRASSFSEQDMPK